MKTKVLMMVMLVISVLLPSSAQATTTPAQAPLSCVEVGWVVDNGAKFGVRNRCEQRIYLKILDQQIQVNSEYLDRGQWFPIQQGRNVELFANEANYQAGTVDRQVELTRDLYCQTLPAGKTVSECEGYVAPTVAPEPEVQPETPQSETPQVEAPEEQATTELQPEMSTQQSIGQIIEQLSDQPYVVAGMIFLAVLIVGGVGMMLIQKLGNRKPKSIYVRSNRRYYRNR